MVHNRIIHGYKTGNYRSNCGVILPLKAASTTSTPSQPDNIINNITYNNNINSTNIEPMHLTSSNYNNATITPQTTETPISFNKMQQQATAQNFQDYKPSSSRSATSSASSSPSPSVTPISNHAVANLLNLQASTNDNNTIPANTYQYNASQSALEPNQTLGGNNNQTAYSPSLMAALANMSNYNQHQPNYPYYDFSNNFQHLMQQIDKNKPKQEINHLHNEEDSSPVTPKKQFQDTPPVSSSCSSSSYSSVNSTPTSLNSSMNRKRALSDVISKLRHNQQSDSKEDEFNEREACEVNTNVRNENMHDNEGCEPISQPETEMNDEDEEYSRYVNGIGLNLKSPKVSVHSGDHTSKPTADTTNTSCMDDYQSLSTADQLSALINVVNTQGLDRSNRNLLTQRPSSTSSVNSKSNSQVNKSEMDLFKLLERANLSQYLVMFTEQGGDDIDQLVEADETEFKEIIELVGMAAKPLHVKRLRKAIEEYKCSRKFIDTSENQSNYVDQNNNPSKDTIKFQSASHRANHSQISSHAISKFLTSPSEADTANASRQSTGNSFSNSFSSNCINLPTPSVSSSSSSSSSNSSISSSKSNSSQLTNQFSINKICTTTDTRGVENTCFNQQSTLPTSSQTVNNTSNFIPFNQQALYPLYQLLNSNNTIANSFTKSNQPGLVNAMLMQHGQEGKLNDQQQQQQQRLSGNTAMMAMMEKQMKMQSCGRADPKMAILNNALLAAGRGLIGNGGDGSNEVDEQIQEQMDEEDEEGNEDEEIEEDNYEEEEFDENADIDEIGKPAHSLLKQPSVSTSDHQNSSFATLHTNPSIKTDQNEKMIKKNKVIELYSKGERCVRKLSQLTGVPLTTVYRVIGKLKGINYNIPRGNGAGRKTILDAQDREILVEILNAQPRISRKALGKELEKRTGKSIHNSTLNRELCRLRHHGHNFAAVHAVAGNSMGKSNNELNSHENHNYMKHFNHSRKSSTANYQNKLLLHHNASTTSFDTSNKLSHQLHQPSQNKTSLPAHSSTTSNLKQHKTTNSRLCFVNKSETTPDTEYMKLIINEAKSMCTSIGNVERNSTPEFTNPDLIMQINDLVNGPLLHTRVDKLRLVMNALLADESSFHLINSGQECVEKPAFYMSCLSEACVQICLLKPNMMTRQRELILYGQEILEKCFNFNGENKMKIKKSSNTDTSDQTINKRPKLESNPLEPIQQQPTNQLNNQFPNNFTTLYTAALALHLQQQQQHQQTPTIQPSVDISSYLSKLPVSLGQQGSSETVDQQQQQQQPLKCQEDLNSNWDQSLGLINQLKMINQQLNGKVNKQSSSEETVNELSGVLSAAEQCFDEEENSVVVSSPDNSYDDTKSEGDSVDRVKNSIHIGIKEELSDDTNFENDTASSNNS